MSSQMSSLTPKKKLIKGGESRNQAIPVLPIFVGYAPVLGKTPYISAEDLFPRCYTVGYWSTTMGVTKADNLRSRVIFQNYASKKSYAVFRTQACISQIHVVLF